MIIITLFFIALGAVFLWLGFMMKCMDDVMLHVGVALIVVGVCLGALDAYHLITGTTDPMVGYFPGLNMTSVGV